MLTILRVRGAGCRNIADLRGAHRSLCFTHRVCTCFRLTSIARKETTSVVITWRLQPDALPCHTAPTLSSLSRLAALAVCPACRLRAKHGHHHRLAAVANPVTCVRLLTH